MTENGASSLDDSINEFVIKMTNYLTNGEGDLSKNQNDQISFEAAVLANSLHQSEKCNIPEEEGTEGTDPPTQTENESENNTTDTVTNIQKNIVNRLIRNNRKGVKSESMLTSCAKKMGNLGYSNHIKGNYGEMITDLFMVESPEFDKKNKLRGAYEGDKKPRKIGKCHCLHKDRVTQLNPAPNKGIDGLYVEGENQKGVYKIYVVDAKYGSAKLGTAQDQMEVNGVFRFVEAKKRNQLSDSLETPVTPQAPESNTGSIDATITTVPKKYDQLSPLWVFDRLESAVDDNQCAAIIGSKIVASVSDPDKDLVFTFVSKVFLCHTTTDSYKKIGDTVLVLDRKVVGQKIGKPKADGTPEHKYPIYKYDDKITYKNGTAYVDQFKNITGSMSPFPIGDTK